MTIPGKTCDCGAPAVGKDGSGYFCAECKVAVSEAQESLASHIRKMRGESLVPARLDRQRIASANYREKNREKVRTNWRKWDKKQPRTPSPFQFNRYREAA